MMPLWSYFHSLDLWMIPLALGLFTIGIIVPFHSIMMVAGAPRKWPFTFFVLVNPVIEEVVFRLLLLSFLANAFGFTIGVVVMSISYSIYMALAYGVPSMADGLVLGFVLSFAMLEFGFPIVVAAHIVYRLAFSVW